MNGEAQEKSEKIDGRRAKVNVTTSRRNVLLYQSQVQSEREKEKTAKETLGWKNYHS